MSYFLLIFKGLSNKTLSDKNRRIKILNCKAKEHGGIKVRKNLNVRI